MNCLTLDVGNSQLAFVIYAGQQRLKTVRMATRPYPSTRELLEICRALLAEFELPLGSLHFSVSSVVPDLRAVLAETAKKLDAQTFHWVDWGSPHPFQASASARSEIGADIIAGLVGATLYCQPPFAVVDCGTATTLTLVDENHMILGVTILPGLLTQMQSLTRSAPHLPQDVSLEPPPMPFGNTTEESLQSGILYGHAASIEGLLARFQALFPQAKVRALACGGLFHRIESLCPSIDFIVPDLVNIGCKTLAAKRIPPSLAGTSSQAVGPAPAARGNDDKARAGGV